MKTVTNNWQKVRWYQYDDASIQAYNKLVSETSDIKQGFTRMENKDLGPFTYYIMH